jgi:hypothetical protein
MIKIRVDGGMSSQVEVNGVLDRVCWGCCSTVQYSVVLPDSTAQYSTVQYTILLPDSTVRYSAVQLLEAGTMWSAPVSWLPKV